MKCAGCPAPVHSMQVLCRKCAYSWLRLNGIPEPLIPIADMGWVQDNARIMQRTLDASDRIRYARYIGGQEDRHEIGGTG